MKEVKCIWYNMCKYADVKCIIKKYTKFPFNYSSTVKCTKNIKG